MFLVLKSKLGTYLFKTFYRRYLTVFRIYLRLRIYQGSEFASCYKYAKALNIPLVLNMLAFSIHFSRNIRKTISKKI